MKKVYKCEKCQADVSDSDKHCGQCGATFIMDAAKPTTDLPNTNLLLYGVFRDINGNNVARLGYPNENTFSIQLNTGSTQNAYRALRSVNGSKGIDGLTTEEKEVIAKELIESIQKYGSKKQKEGLKIYGQKNDAVDKKVTATAPKEVEAVVSTAFYGTITKVENLTSQGANVWAVTVDNKGVPIPARSLKALAAAKGFEQLKAIGKDVYIAYFNV